MPAYQWSAPVGMLTDSTRAQVAAAITDAHVEATGAPPVFVHVFFNELPPGVSYTAGDVDGKISWITGAIRAGRPLDVKQKLIKSISASWSAITGQPERELVAGLTEIDPAVTMEFGLSFRAPEAKPNGSPATRMPSPEFRAQDSSWPWRTPTCPSTPSTSTAERPTT